MRCIAKLYNSIVKPGAGSILRWPHPPQAAHRYTSPMQPVSIIATVLNEVEDIARLVPSLLAQIPPPAEVIIVDGGSADGTWEWLIDAAEKNPALRPIRDESCNLKCSPGPYPKAAMWPSPPPSPKLSPAPMPAAPMRQDWLSRITAPLHRLHRRICSGRRPPRSQRPHSLGRRLRALFRGQALRFGANQVLHGTFHGVYNKGLWLRIGGFPESLFFGEDTLFDHQARRLTAPAFVPFAKAIYRPQYSLQSACRQLARYAISDGILGVRPARLFRNAARCIVEVLALASVHWTAIPLLVVLALESWFAFHLDWRTIRRSGLRTLLARFVFSVLVPWIVATNQIRGAITGRIPANRQNLG
jgi:hypothetical protein